MENGIPHGSPKQMDLELRLHRVDSGPGGFSPQRVSRVLAHWGGDPHISPPEEAHLTDTPPAPLFQALRQKPMVLPAEQQGIVAGFTSNDRLEA